MISNSSSPLPHFSSEFIFCLSNEPGKVIFVPYLIFGFLVLLPIFILVLHMGHHLWRKQRSVGHSDFLTYNMIIIEIIGLFGCSLYICGVYTYEEDVLMAGVYLYSVTTPGQTLFHVLTCVDRFVAVVYPVAYRSLKHGGGVKIRNVCTVCVWMCCLFGMAVLDEIISKSKGILAFSFWIVSLVFISFFSLSVLCVLIRPGPGDRKQVDQSKRRASSTITIILCVLMMRCVGFLVACAIFTLSWLRLQVRCAVIMSFAWFSVPSSLVLPLMFLHRLGKLCCCKLHPDSG